MEENEIAESCVNEERVSKGNEKRRSGGSKMGENEESLISLVKENDLTESREYKGRGNEGKKKRRSRGSMDRGRSKGK